MRPAVAPVFVALVIAALVPSALHAQEPAAAPPPAPPPPGWTGSIGGGLAVTNGNTDTSTFNIGADVLRDAGTDLVFKTTALLLKGNSSGASNLDRSQADTRLDYRLSPRLSAFTLATFARDRFKAIDYLLAPTAGLSYEFVDRERVKWTLDSSVGVVFEKNRRRSVNTSGALLTAEKLSYQFGRSSRLTHSATGLWKAEDFGDAFYTGSIGVLTSLAGSLDLKTEFLSTYKRKPTDAALKKADQSIVLSVVYKY